MKSAGGQELLIGIIIIITKALIAKRSPNFAGPCLAANGKHTKEQDALLDWPERMEGVADVK